MKTKTLPEGWKEVELGELGKINAGGTPSRMIREYWNGDIPWLKISNLKSFYVKEYDESITKEGLKNSSARLFPKGTILISIFATLGDVAILDIEATTNQAIAGISDLRKDVDRVYLTYYLKTLKKHFERTGRGVAQNNINLNILKKTKLPLPPLSTQRAIVSILEKAEKLKQQRAEADKLTREYLQSVFAEMFMGKDFPIGSIRDLVAEVKYGTSKKADENKGNYEVLRMNNITYEGTWDFADLKYMDLDERDEENHTVVKGDILFNRTNSKELVGKTAVYRESRKRAFAGYLVRARVNEKSDPEYISAFLNSVYGKKILFSMCKSIVGMANINAQEFQNIEIPLPPLPLQQKFASIVEKVEEMKEKQKQSKVEIDNLFNVLMQKAFNGELLR